VAAGGGSRLFFERGLYKVGPESAGADPGPVCYRKQGGTLAITDANLILGRLLPDFFPKIFGPHENEPLDFARTKYTFEKLTNEINSSN
jgi:5-oxoprolinase (ATP-hydrolysing)